MMTKRIARHKLREMASKFPVILLTGPRQSGKTTLCRDEFAEYQYVSLENPDNLYFAENDPKGFLNIYNRFVIIDEAQKCPVLFSYIQQIVDESGINGQFILTGSQNFLLLEKITQSLAGRVYIMELLPFSQEEHASSNWPKAILNGGYPRLYDQQISPQDFFPSYLQTYIERDIRSIINIQDLSMFRKFIYLLAHHTGQLMNFNRLSKELGMDIKTVQRWFSLLETSYIVFTLKPWHKNFSKRLMKSPKMYFYDTGLVSFLLGIASEDELILSSYKGALFENFAVTELLKAHLNRGVSRNFFYWRDSNGNEIDLIIERGSTIQVIEMKASETVKPEYIKGLHYLDTHLTQMRATHFLLNTMNASQPRSNETILSWKDAAQLVE
jgi:uncharacterized protein